MESMHSILRVLLFCALLNYKVITGYDLTIVHNNDVHAHFDQTNVLSGDCSESQASNDECYGGEARRVTVIKEARANIPNTLVLDAGDRYVGTLWFTTYKGRAASYFVNKENYDAMCLGNHEFDLGVDGLLPFLENLTVPLVDANIDVSAEPRLQGKFNKSMVLERGGQKIGIVGFITVDTRFSSQPGPTVQFTDVIEATRAEVENLKAAGIKIIIGLSHAGYYVDMKVAAEVDGLDVIIGGHTHTFLYTGDEAPSTEDIQGPYPTVVKGPSDKNVLVAQAYAWGKYMGILNVTFDENFDVQSWSGNPLLLDKTVVQDADTLADIERMIKPLEATKARIIGSAAVKLEGERWQCRMRECNSGNLITDAMIWYHIDNKEFNDTWALAAIALQNAGGIRATTAPGPVSQGQVLSVLPFGNTIEMVTIKGIHLREAFENSVQGYNPLDPPGAFLQVSGVRVQYDLSKEPGKRVVLLEARCLRCTVPTYSPVNDEEEYNVLLNAFTLGGGDKYTMIKDNVIRKVELNSLDVDVLAAYFENHPLVFPETEGRVKFINSTSDAIYSMTPTSPTISQQSSTGRPIIVHRCPETRLNSASVLTLNLTFISLLFLIVTLNCC